jgi:hypothetical protein
MPIQQIDLDVREMDVKTQRSISKKREKNLFWMFIVKSPVIPKT